MSMRTPFVAAALSAGLSLSACVTAPSPDAVRASAPRRAVDLGYDVSRPEFPEI